MEPVAEDVEWIFDGSHVDELGRIELAWLRELVKSLPPKDKEMVVRRFWGGSSWAETSIDMGHRPQWGEQTWRTRLRPTLRKMLIDMGIEKE